MQILAFTALIHIFGNDKNILKYSEEYQFLNTVVLESTETVTSIFL